MTKETIKAHIAQLVAAIDFGEPSAVKRGGFPQWPYVAVIKRYLGQENTTHNPMGRRAYATRDEATSAAARYIEVLRADRRAQLADPRMRALREQHGMPREIDAT